MSRAVGTPVYCSTAFGEVVKVFLLTALPDQSFFQGDFFSRIQPHTTRVYERRVSSRSAVCSAKCKQRSRPREVPGAYIDCDVGDEVACLFLGSELFLVSADATQTVTRSSICRLVLNNSLIFSVGCLLLPFVWAVNAVWFFKEAFMKPPFEEQQQIKKYVIMSSVGAVIWTVVMVTWIAAFQINRVAWGSVGDALTYLYPLGRP
ncbi:Gamma-secretase subunit pen-2 [Eumeta japonica]|uniref:Gamma-secretase subunit PEN-2 n=1 Tax=Eumeta variegata TaxID=151549 RepID=A0A4C1X0S5_EUMVA|nr:Gamma-secretase subunit pen-2 [Eumeta japonica]